MPDRMALGAFLKKLRERIVDEKGAPLAAAEAARRTEMWDQKPLSDSFWSAVEKGRSLAEPHELLRMALAVDATSEDAARLFDLAGYGVLARYFINVGQRRANLVHGAEAGILTDPDLSRERREELLKRLREIRIIDALEDERHTLADFEISVPEPGEPG